MGNGVLEYWSDGVMVRGGGGAQHSISPILMSLSGMVEIPRPFAMTADMLQAKRSSVMPAEAGIQCGGGGRRKTWIPASALG